MYIKVFYLKTNILIKNKLNILIKCNGQVRRRYEMHVKKPYR